MSEHWLELTLPVPAQDMDRVCDTLTNNGMTGLVVEEEGEFLKFLEQNRQYWDYVDEDLARRMKGASLVKFYVPDNEEGEAQMRAALRGLEQYEPQTVSLREGTGPPPGRSTISPFRWVSGCTSSPSG